MTTRPRSLLWFDVLIAAVLMLSACSSNGSGNGSSNGGRDQVASLADSGTATASARPTAGLEKELTDYTECLRKQGVDVPDPTVDADGNITLGRPKAGATLDRDKVSAAQKVCGPLPQGLTSALTGQDQTELQDLALTFARCMREQGVDVPDPDPSDVGGLFGDLDRDDPKVAAAVEVCQKVWTGLTLRGGH